MKLTNNTIKKTVSILKERKIANSKRDPEQLDELLGGLKRMLGKPGSPEDQAVLDYVKDLSSLIGDFPELSSMIKKLSDPFQIKRGIKGEIDYSKAGATAGRDDRRKVSPRNAKSKLPRVIQQLERLQTAAQGKVFKGTCGLMMRLVQAYRDVILGDESDRRVSQAANTERDVERSLGKYNLSDPLKQRRLPR